MIIDINLKSRRRWIKVGLTQWATLPHLTNKTLMSLIHCLCYGIKSSIACIGNIIVGTKISIMVKRLTLRAHKGRISMQIIESGGRAHKRLTNILVVPLIPSQRLKQVPNIINI